MTLFSELAGLMSTQTPLSAHRHKWVKESSYSLEVLCLSVNPHNSALIIPILQIGKYAQRAPFYQGPIAHKDWGRSQAKPAGAQSLRSALHSL